MNSNLSIHSLDSEYSLQAQKPRQEQSPCLENEVRETEVLYPLNRKAGLSFVTKCLQKNSLLHLMGNHRGERLSGVQGVVWITQVGNPEDIYLHEGETFEISETGAVLIQGMVESRLRITRGQSGRRVGRVVRDSVGHFRGWIDHLA
jgi:hypothetical protein